MNQSSSHSLALLLAPVAGEAAMYNDLVAMTHALQQRGLPADQILALHGDVDRLQVLAFLQAAHRQMAGWNSGSLFVHVTGHGFFQGETAAQARPGLELRNTGDFTDTYHLFWDEFFAALDLPNGVQLTLLPDL